MKYKPAEESHAESEQDKEWGPVNQGHGKASEEGNTEGSAEKRKSLMFLLPEREETI